MFDKSPDQLIGQKAVNGFTISATIAANFNLTTDFDALILTLCKFTSILNASKEMNEIQMGVALGLNQKAQVAAKTVFSLVQRYGDSMREGWKNIFEVIGQLFKLKLLPRSLVEIEDFCKPNGKYMLLPERVPVQRPEAAGLFSSLYSYLSSDNQRQPSYEEQEIIKVARKSIKECRIDQIIQESKFLTVDTLQELLQALEVSLKPPTSHKSATGVDRYEEDVTLFMLELYVRVLVQNKDRLLPIWEKSKAPLYRLLFNDGKSYGHDQLLVRTTVAIFRLSALLMRSEELCSVVLQSLKTFLRFKSTTILKLSRAISIGMYELLKTSAQHIHTEADWAIVFTILECVGAGAMNTEFEQWLATEETAAAAATTTANGSGAKSDGALSSEEDSGVADRGYTSDSELIRPSATTTTASSPTTENWIMVTADADVQNSPVRQPLPVLNSLAFPCKLTEHSPFALVKCWDSVAFIVRNVAHITPYNFEGCVRCIRTFVEASLSGPRQATRDQSHAKGKNNKRDDRKISSGTSVSGIGGDVASSDGDSDCEDLSDRYPNIAIQFLDIMHTLHTRTANIFLWWAEEGGAMPQGSTLWSQAWCPLLQGMARLGTDQRRNVRTGAITCLQRALLAHDLQTLSGPEWEGCFRQVLFPLLSNLLAEQVPPVGAGDPSLMEETRMRTATIMSKVFLHHLSPLLTLAEFASLWLEILEYLERFMRIGSDMLYEAMLEGLKNMLLVMNSVRVFHNADGVTHSALWNITWDKIGLFLPNLKGELFKGEDEQRVTAATIPPDVVPQELPSTPNVGFYPNSAVADDAANMVVVVESSVNSGHTSPVPEADHYQQTPTQVGMVVVPPSQIMYAGANVSPTFGYPNNMPSEFGPNQMGLQNVPTPMVAPRHQEMAYDMQQQQQLHIANPPSTASPTHVGQPMPVNTPGNQYPTFTRIPPASIVQSFAPIYVQPSMVPSGGEIYSDYVRDPYNLTLPPLLDNVNGSKATEIATGQEVEAHAPPQNPFTVNSNVFQSSNYFGADTGVIPPGSEVLFGGTRP